MATLEEVSKSGHGYRGMGNTVCARGTVKYCNHLKNHQAVPSEVKRTLSYHVLSIYPREIKTESHMQMLIVVSLMTVKIKIVKCASINQWMNDVWCIHTETCYRHVQCIHTQ